MARERPIKDILIEKTAEERGQPINVVEDVLRWVFSDAVSAMKTYEEVEISGWGKYMISQTKLKKRIADKERMLFYLKRMPSSPDTQKKIDEITHTLEYFYSKLKTNETHKESILPNSGGIQEFGDSTGSFEGTNRECGEREAGNMQELSS